MRILPLLKTMGPVLILGALAACGGYTPPPAATTNAISAASGLTYTDPATTGWALVKNPASTPTQIVLDLVGPAGLTARGVGFNLTSDGSVRFQKFPDGNYVKDLNAFSLGLSSPNLYQTKYAGYYEPVIMVGGVKNAGKLLTVGLFQKDRHQDAKAVGKPVCQIAINFDPTAGVPAGTTLPLTMVRARIIPADIGTMPTEPQGDWSDVLKKFRMEDIQIAVGTLRAQ